MKPPRLKLLIALHVLIGLMIGFSGLVSTGGFGAWTSGALSCFFTAHLLAIPHHSGRYWTAFVALGLFAISAVKLAEFFEFAGFHSSDNLPTVIALGLPLLYFMLGLLILTISLHSSVCDYFDELEITR